MTSGHAIWIDSSMSRMQLESVRRMLHNPFSISNCPEFKVPPLLGPDEASYILSSVGVLVQMNDMGHIDINSEVSLFSSYTAMPKQGHFKTVLHVMCYMNLIHNSQSAFGPSYPNSDQSNVWECDWTDFYEGAVELIPSNALLPRVKEVDLCTLIDSYHAGTRQTRCSRTKFVIHI